MKTILHHYPNAHSLSQLEELIVKELRKNAFTPKKTIWGTSICSDEVNNSFNMLNRDFAGSGAFRFGGISGLPFAGKTGMMAFESHIPDNGDAFILYGPHIGISKEGLIGTVRRDGQELNTTCCGSLAAGFSAVKSGFSPTIPEIEDYQQSKVQELIFSERDHFAETNYSLKDITEFLLQEIKSQLMSIIESTNSSLKGTKILLMGGIVINTDWDVEDYFEIRETKLLKF